MKIVTILTSLRRLYLYHSSWPFTDIIDGLYCNHIRGVGFQQFYHGALKAIRDEENQVIFNPNNV